jgi:hypothetical protein
MSSVFSRKTRRSIKPSRAKNHAGPKPTDAQVPPPPGVMLDLIRQPYQEVRVLPKKPDSTSRGRRAPSCDIEFLNHLTESYLKIRRCQAHPFDTLENKSAILKNYATARRSRAGSESQNPRQSVHKSRHLRRSRRQIPDFWPSQPDFWPSQPDFWPSQPDFWPSQVVRSN